MATDELVFKVLSLGDSGVGKTCLILRYTDNTFDDSSLATIGVDFKLKSIEYKSRKAKMKIWDTAGQEKYKLLTQQYYKNADGILLMFDTNNYSSFERISYWMEQIKLFAHLESTPIILIGTKTDKNERKVDIKEAEEAAKKFNLDFIETSAKKNENISQVFELLYEKIFEVKSRYIYDHINNKGTVFINLSKQKEEEEKRLREQKKCCRK